MPKSEVEKTELSKEKDFEAGELHSSKIEPTTNKPSDSEEGLITTEATLATEKQTSMKTNSSEIEESDKPLKANLNATEPIIEDVTADETSTKELSTEEIKRELPDVSHESGEPAPLQVQPAQRTREELGIIKPIPEETEQLHETIIEVSLFLLVR